MLNLFNAKEIEEELFNKVRQNILPLESLFVFGTNAENLKEIIKALKEEKQEKDLGDVFNINKEADKITLLIPVYKESDKIFAEEKEPQKYGISKDDFELASSYFKHLGEKIVLVKYECELKVLETANKSIQHEDEKERRYDFTETRSIAEPELLVDRILDYFSVKIREFDSFKKLENEIVHFKRIKFSDGDKYKEIMSKIQQVRNYEQKDAVLGQLQLDFEKHKNIKKFTSQVQKVESEYQKESVFELKNQKVKIKYLANHYYLPVVVSESEKVDYLNHIIDVESEIKFIEQLEEYLQKENNGFKQFDWWMFSKLDQTLDEVHIPYYNPKENAIAKFKPDFIFWMQKRNEYLILFVDPKGTEHGDGYRKIDGYANIFESKEHRNSKSFPYNGYNIKTKLLLKPRRGIAGVLDNYKKYWFDNFVDFGKKINLKAP